MLTQICSDFNCLPPLRDITIDEIEFFYNSIVDSVLAAQKKAKEKNKLNG